MNHSKDEQLKKIRKINIVLMLGLIVDVFVFLFINEIFKLDQLLQVELWLYLVIANLIITGIAMFFMAAIIFMAGYKFGLKQAWQSEEQKP